MRIVGSAAYLQDRARRRGGRALFLVVAGVVAVAAGFIAAQAPGATVLTSGFPAFAGFGAVVVGMLQGSAARRDADSAGAEAPVIAQLRARLSDDYLYLRNVVLPGRTTAADAVVLGPHGALVLGIYPTPGSFTVKGDDWFTGRGDSLEPLRESPSWRLARPLRGLQRLAVEEDLTGLPVNGAVVLARGDLAGAEKPSVAVVPASKIASYVEYLRPQDPEPLREPVQRLAGLLTPLAAGGPSTVESPTGDTAAA
ncbi:MAG TPA: nuclease-related domain-containing protein [Chloroflexota bacterium]|nr:nuclease-related domain-containing protein [Chloroflexota bacterium]